MARRVFLLRHGQSEYNAGFEATGQDPGIVDARLTALGRAQAVAARDALREFEFDLVVTSPTGRTLETLLLAFEGRALPPVFVHADMRERLADMCDIGTPASALAREFPAFEFSHLEEHWWYLHGTPDRRGVPMEPREICAQRHARFHAWLCDRAEQTILVIGHWGLFRDLAGMRLANGEFVEWTGFPRPK